MCKTGGTFLPLCEGLALLNFQLKKIFGEKFFGRKNEIWSKNLLVEKVLGEKNFGRKIFLVKKSFARIKLLVKTKFWTKKTFLIGNMF